MKLGTETNSLVNHLYSCAVIGQPEPTVGMGATMLSWTDRNAGTIVEVFKVGKLTYITVQDDEAKVVKGSGQDGSAEYEFTPNPDGSRNTFRREASGKWTHIRKNLTTGRWIKSGGYGLRIGARDKYRDPHF